MNYTVVPRQIDELGRVVIPNDFRQKLGIPSYQDMPVYLSAPDENGTYTLTTYPINPNTIIQAVLGFLIIPQAYRFEYNLNESMLDLWIEDGKLHFKKTVLQCIVSGETDNLIRYRHSNKFLSERVIRELYDLLDHTT